MSKESEGGHLYIQTSEIQNAVIHFLRAADGTISETDRVLTGGAGSGSFNYRVTPPGLIVEGANSVLLSRRISACYLRSTRVTTRSLREVSLHHPIGDVD